MSKKSPPGNYENLTISKCKRIVRPLVSKIHALNDLNSKYPSILDFNFPHDDHCLSNDLDKNVVNFFQNYRKYGNEYDQSEQTTKVRKLESNHVNIKIYEYDNDYDEICESPSSSIIKDRLPEDDEIRSSINNLIEPQSSFNRLKSLKPFISNQLYQAYCDMFSIFRNIINLLILNMEDVHRFSGIPKLSSLCSFKMGKFIALSTKPTYYELNQSLLFDPNTIPYHLREYRDILSDDIDEWLEIKPELVSQTYRIELLIGYVVHLLVINLDQTLYLLIPILSHWLSEELDKTRNKMLKSISRTLYIEYWNYGPDYSEGAGFDNVVTILNGSQNRKQNLSVFWIFHKIGYWENLINTLKLNSSIFNTSSYETLTLDVLPLNTKLNLKVLTKFEEHFNGHNFLHDIYKMIQNNPQHPQVNNILILTITQTISNTRISLRQSNSPHDILRCFRLSYNKIVMFVHVWLSLPVNEEFLVYNSLYPGNSELFHALISFTNYQIRQCNLLLLYLDKPKKIAVPNIKMDTRSIIELEKIKNKMSMLDKIIKLLKLYFLDMFEDFTIQPYTVEEISTFILFIQNPNLNTIKSNKFRNSSYNEFLVWLFDRQDPSLHQISQICFQKYYGTKDWFRDTLIEALYCLLFKTDIQNTSSSSIDINESILADSDVGDNETDWDDNSLT